jgi:hypothetical protein
LHNAEDPNSVFDPKKFSFLMQKQLANGELKEANMMESQFDHIDAIRFC